MKNRLGTSRRGFLRQLGLAAGAAASSSNALAQLGAVAGSPEQKHVIVVGGGVAGLCAAYELQKYGHRVTILEAEASHVGGRVRTHRWDESNYGELGAMRIPKVHNLTRHYVREFGLSLRPFVHSNPEGYYYIRGNKVRIKDEPQVNALYPNLTPEERTMSPFDMWDRAVLKILGQLTPEEIADLRRVRLETRRIKELDQMSLEAVLKQGGLSAEAIEMLCVTWAYETSLQTGITTLLREENEAVWTQEFDEIVGGMDTLPRAFAERLRTPLVMGAEVMRVEQARDGKVTAIYRQRGEMRRVEGDYMIVTVPLGVLQRIPFAPGMSGEKERAMRQITYDSSTKVIAQARRRFWETDEGIYGGGTYTDLITGITYYPADNAVAKDARVSQGSGTFLASYSWGQPARRLAALAPGERHRVTFEQLAKIHPQLQDPTMIEKVMSWSWDNNPNTCGAFCWWAPGQHEALYEHIIRPEGRIHFAGEHTSLTHTWIQGAIESALRVVKEVQTSIAG